MFSTNMVKVCHLTVLHRLDDMRIFHKECVSLSKAGFEVTLLGFGEKEGVEIREGVKVVTMCIPVSNGIEMLLKRPHTIFQKAKEIDADIYHIHDPDLLHVGMKLKRIGKKVIFDSHEFYGYQLYYGVHKPKIIKVPLFTMRLFAKAYMKYEAMVCRKIDAVVEVCLVNGKDYFANRSKRVVFVRNTPIIECDEAEQQYAANNNVVYIGGMTYERGICQLLEACNKINATLILAGKFVSPSYGEQIMQSEAFKCADFRGFLDKDGMKEAIRQSSVGASTLLNVGQYVCIDTFPTKVFDYLCQGIPVVISNTPFHVKMNEQYHFGICVDPSNAEEIADAIQKLLSNPEKAETLGGNGKKMIAENWNWKIDEKNLIDLYKSLI